MQVFTMFSVYDRVAGSYGPIILGVNSDVVRRNLQDFLATCPDSDYFKHSADFDLYQIGSYENWSGRVNSDVSFVCRLADLMPVKGSAVGDSSPEDVHTPDTVECGVVHYA